MAAKEQKKLITTPTLVLMIISTIYGFGNVSIAYDQMAYAGMFWHQDDAGDGYQFSLVV